MQPQPPAGPYYPQPQQPPKKSKTLWIVLGIVGGAALLIVVGLTMIPSSTKYMKKSKRSEAEFHLNAIEKASKVLVVETAGFVVGSAPLTPDEGCCRTGSPQMGKCPAEPGAWTGVWEELGFSIDESHLFQYSYDGTTDHFVARAVGDLDCDSTMITYTLEGTMTDGNPRFELTKPSAMD